MEQEQLIIPKEQVTTKVLQFLAGNEYAQIVPLKDPENPSSDIKMQCFSKMSIARDKSSLEAACRSGVDILLLPERAEELEELKHVITSFDYALSSDSGAIILTEDQGGADPLSYYTKVFDQRLESELEPQYKRSSGTRSGNLQDYNMRYEDFVIDEVKEVVLIKSTGITKQAAAITLVLETDGSCREPSILMQLSKFSLGALADSFFDNRHSEFLGIFPDTIRITIEQPDRKLNHCFVVPNENQQAPSTLVRRSPHEFKLQFGLKFGPIQLACEKTYKKPESVTSSSVSPVYEGDNTCCCLEWTLESWGNGERYNRDKPHFGLRMSGWPRLPFRGTGPIIGGLPRVRWINLPDEGSVSFKVTIESRMVLLRKKSIDFCGLIQAGFAVSSYKTKLEHTATMTLRKIG